MKIITPNFSKEIIREKTTSILKGLIKHNELGFLEYSFFGNSEKQLRLDELNLTNGKSKKSLDRITIPLLSDLFYGLSEWIFSEYLKLNPYLSQDPTSKEFAYEYVDDIVTTGKIFTCEEWVKILYDAFKD